MKGKELQGIILRQSILCNRMLEKPTEEDLEDLVKASEALLKSLTKG